VKYWEIISDNLRKAGWSLGYVSAIDSDGRTSLMTHTATTEPVSSLVGEEKLTAFLEVERVTLESLRFPNAEWFGTILAVQPFARFSLGTPKNRLTGRSVIIVRP
jgi:hypothetical protein